MLANCQKAVWKGTRRWTQNALDKTSERILNAQPADDDDDDDDGDVDVTVDDSGPSETRAPAEATEPVMKNESIKLEDSCPHPGLKQRV
jgi:hypothetical protein